VPVSLITSSVKKHLLLVNLHDLITDIMVMPGIYTDKYTIAADVSLKFVYFKEPITVKAIMLSRAYILL